MPGTTGAGHCSRRRARTSAKHFELMLDFMEQHPNLAMSQLDSSYTVKDRKREWGEFAQYLNSRPLGMQKDTDKWRKTWFDWKCNVRAKARSAAGKKSLSPLEKRLIAITDLLDSDDAPAARKDALPYAEVVYEVEDTSNAAYIAGAPSRTEAMGSAEPIPDSVQSGYGESQGEYIVPTSEMSVPVNSTMVHVPAGTASSGRPSLLLSNVSSLSNGPRPAVGVKLEVVDDENGENGELNSEVDANDSQQASVATAEDSSPQFRWAQQEEGPQSQPLDATGNLTPVGRSGRRATPADGADSFGAASLDDLKTRFELQIFTATKRKLEADERRADAEAEFYRQEIKRSMALANLHGEEQRKIAAIADFHEEERRRAAAKVEMLLEHKKFFVQQQKTEVFKRRLLQLEIKKLKRQLDRDTDAE